MITENLSTLKIHRLTQEQYDKAVADGSIDENALYLTPEEKIDLSPYATVEQMESKVPLTRTVNSKALSADITLTAEDVGADPAGAAAAAEGRANVYTADLVGDQTVAEQIANAGHMTSTNPTGTGSFTMNHLDGDAIGENSVALGCQTVASGSASFAVGNNAFATGNSSHAEGFSTRASGDYSHAEGGFSASKGEASHAEGYDTTASGDNSHAEGYKTTAMGNYSHAEGNSDERAWIVTNNYGIELDQATSDNILEVHYRAYDDDTNMFSLAYGDYSHIEGSNCLALGLASHAEGRDTYATSTYSHAEGTHTKATGSGSHAEGASTQASGIGSHAEGMHNIASGNCSHVEGITSTASGMYSHAEGHSTTASGTNSHAEGCHTTALDNQHAQGHYNNTTNASKGVESGVSDGTAFVIGNGTSTSLSNAFRVSYNGTVYATNKTISTGADYAEFFEWQDTNPNNEDRRGYFVTLDGDKIKLAEPSDYILGVVSGQPAMIGNGDEEWMGRYVLDDFGAFIYEDFEYKEEIPEEIQEEVVDEVTGEATMVTKTVIKTVVKTGTKRKENPDYDPTRPYVQREDRPEWDAVGMLGVLSVRDDGTCQVNGYCQVAEGGIATASDTGYRVIKRINDYIVQVVFK